MRSKAVGGISNMPRGIRKSITIPGLPVPTIRQRFKELGYLLFVPYAVELNDPALLRTGPTSG